MEEILTEARRRAEEIVRAAHEEAERDLAALTERRDALNERLNGVQEMLRRMEEAPEKAGLPPPRRSVWSRLRGR